jgi:hypothetical protein
MHDIIDMGLTTYCRKCDKTWDTSNEAPECVVEDAVPTHQHAKDLLHWVNVTYGRDAAKGFFPNGRKSVSEFDSEDDAACVQAIRAAYPDRDTALDEDFSLPLPDGNPKTRMGALKVPLHLVPPSARHFLALAFENGAGKYGPANWRDEPVSASVYVGAAGRHLDAYWDGEDLAEDSLVHHLAHAMACCAIILDAMECGTLNDDRYTKGPTSKLQERYLESKK